MIPANLRLERTGGGVEERGAKITYSGQSQNQLLVPGTA